VVEAVLFAPVFLHAVHPGSVLRSRRLVRDWDLRHTAGGPSDAELPEAEDHPGVPGSGLLGPGGEEGCAGAGGELG